MFDIRGWLEKHDLDQYADTFEENEIDRTLLPELSDSDLEKLGAFARITQRDCRPDSATCAGDKGNASVQSFHRVGLWLRVSNFTFPIAKRKRPLSPFPSGINR